MNITERFFRAVAIKWGKAVGRGPFKEVSKETKGITHIMHPNGEWIPVIGYGLLQIPDPTQSWPDFKKYVIPVMRERDRSLTVSSMHNEVSWDGQHKRTKQVWWSRPIKVKNDETLLAAVEAAVAVLEGEK